jgi:hypothetical protein
MFDLNRIAKRLLNPDLPEVVRAVDLFELQAAVFLQRNTDRGLARKYCAMMLLNHIEERDGVRKGDLARAASLSGYCELFGEIMREGGWLGLSRLRSRYGFDIKLQEGFHNSKVVAEAVELVCRSAQGGQQLSLECAERINRSWFKEASGHEPVRSPGRTKEEAALTYLLLTHCADLLAPVLKKVSFAEQLLEQVRDIASLRKLVSAYNRVLALLLPTSQQPGRPSLLKNDEVESSIQWKPLDAETRQLIDNNAKAGRHRLG